MKMLSTFFSDIHMQFPEKPSDRFVEYPFAVARLPNPGAKILDIGCSGSYFPLILSSFGYDVTACDIRPYEILNHLAYDNFSFIQQDISSDPLPENSFDTVTCISTLEHIGIAGRYGKQEDVSSDLKMADQISRVVKRNGSALITIPYGVAEIVSPFHRIYDHARIKKIEAGFDVIEESFYSLDSSGDWVSCTAQAGENIRGGRDKYGLALIHLIKP